jgi:hypothetical protein
MVEATHQGLRARWPGRTGDPASLELIGRDRVLRRGPGEPNTTYAARLRAWRQTHRTRGNPFNMLRQIRAFLGAYSPIRLRYVDERGDWFTLDENGVESYEMLRANWFWDETTLNPNWSRCWIILQPLTSGWSGDDGTWGDGSTWGDDGTGWGSTVSLGEVEGVRQIIADSKCFGSRFPYIIIAGPTDLAPTGAGWPYELPQEVAFSDNDAGTQVPVRVGTCLYWKGPLS